MKHKHLRLRGNVWFFQKRLNQHQQLVLGKKVLLRSLKTDSLKEAKHSRDELLKYLDSLVPVDAKHPQRRLRALIQEFRKVSTELPNDVYLDDIYGQPQDLESKGDAVMADAIIIADNPSIDTAPISGIKLSYSLEEVQDEFLTFIEANKDITTYRVYKRGIENFKLFKKASNIPLESITRGDVIRFITYLNTVKSLSKKSIQNQLGGLSLLFKYARDRDWIKPIDNPFHGHKIGDLVTTTAKEGDISRPFTPHEFKQIMSTIKASNRVDEGTKWIAPIALVSGLRLAEVCGLLKDDVQEYQGVWCFNIKPNEHRTLKNANASRIVPIHHSVLDIVLKLKKTSSNEFLFESMKGNKNIGGSYGVFFSRTKKRVLPNDGKELCFHSLRKNFATMLENSEVPEDKAASLLGHSFRTLSYGLYSEGKHSTVLKVELNKIDDIVAPYLESFPKE